VSSRSTVTASLARSLKPTITRNRRSASSIPAAVQRSPSPPVCQRLTLRELRFPDVPSNRYAELAPKVRELCARYDLPYTSGPLHRQYAQVVKRVLRLALPGGGERPTEHDDADHQAAPLARAAAA
jgi:hypothetical protein